MKLCTIKEENLIINAFPGIGEQLIEWPDDFLPNKIAISIFDRWLGQEGMREIDVIDQSSEERKKANNKHMKFISLLYDSFNLYTYTHLTTNKIAWKNFDSKEEALNCCKYDSEKSSDSFFFIIIPEISCIYYENWDYTNVLWFSEKEKIKPIFEFVNAAGLHTIEFLDH